MLPRLTIQPTLNHTQHTIHTSAFINPPWKGVPLPAVGDVTAPHYPANAQSHTTYHTHLCIHKSPLEGGAASAVGDVTVPHYPANTQSHTTYHTHLCIHKSPLEGGAASSGGGCYRSSLSSQHSITHNIPYTPLHS